MRSGVRVFYDVKNVFVDHHVLLVASHKSSWVYQRAILE